MGTFRTTIDIAAPPERVYEHFVRPELLVAWMGDWAELDPTPGGHPGPDPWARSLPGP